MDKDFIKRAALIVIAVVMLVTGLVAFRVHRKHAAEAYKKAHAEEVAREEAAWNALGLVWDRRRAKVNPDASMELLNDAKRKIEIVEDEEEKSKLSSEWSKAETELKTYLSNAAEYEKSARRLVSALWDNTNQVIYKGVDWYQINDARAAVERVPNKSVRTELEATIAKAEDYIRAREEVARAAIEALWDVKKNQLADDANRGDYPEAKALVDALPGGDVKKELTSYCEAVAAAYLAEDEAKVKASFEKVWNFGMEQLTYDADRNTFEAALKDMEILPSESRFRLELEQVIPKIEKALNKREQESDAELERQEVEAESRRQAEEQARQQAEDEIQEDAFEEASRPDVQDPTLAPVELD